jgi:hypothetical protein
LFRNTVARHVVREANVQALANIKDHGLFLAATHN